jgi:ribose transport system ATP-binding protein
MLICDRIAVMSAGRLTGIFERDGWTQEALLAAAFAGHISATAAAPAATRGNAPDVRSLS